MTPEQACRLIAQGETLSIEFKGEARESLNDRDLVETAVCLANRSGRESAWLLIGVEDDGHVTGARPRHGRGVLRGKGPLDLCLPLITPRQARYRALPARPTRAGVRPGNGPPDRFLTLSPLRMKGSDRL